MSDRRGSLNDIPTVQDGRILRLSASTIKMFDKDSTGGCPRRFFFEKVLGEKPPTTASQAMGAAEHKEIEHYLETGEDVLSPITRVGKHHIPDPGTVRPQNIEAPIFTIEDGVVQSSLTVEGIPMVGFIDLVHQDEDNNPEIIDWKTTSSIASWAKTPQQLRTDVQMVTYGMWLVRDSLVEFEDTDLVRLSHVYFQTKGRRASEKRSTLVDVRHLEDRWERIGRIVREMKDVAAETDVEDIEPNLSACSAYRGCPHRERCPRGDYNIISAIFGADTNEKEAKMGLLDEIKKNRAAAASKAPTPTPVGKAPALPPDAPVSGEDVPAAEPLPPEAPEVAPTPAPEPTPEPETVTVPAAVDAPKPASIDDYKKMKKAELVKLLEQGNTGTAPAASQPRVLVIDATVTPGFEPSADIDIVGLNSVVVDFCRKLEKRFDAVDIRAGGEKLGFGKWKGFLAAMCRELTLAPGVNYIHAGHDERFQVAAEAFAENADVVIRGS